MCIHLWGEGEPSLYNVTAYFILSWMVFGFVRYRNLAYAHTARRPHEFGFEDLDFKFDKEGRLLQVRLKVWEKGDKLKRASKPSRDLTFNARGGTTALGLPAVMGPAEASLELLRLMKINPRAPRGYLQKPKGGARAPFLASNFTSWLIAVTEDLDLPSIGRSLIPSMVRAGSFTHAARFMPESQLHKISGHASPATTHQHYLGMSRDERVSLQGALVEWTLAETAALSDATAREGGTRHPAQR